VIKAVGKQKWTERLIRNRIKQAKAGKKRVKRRTRADKGGKISGQKGEKSGQKAVGIQVETKGRWVYKVVGCIKHLQVSGFGGSLKLGAGVRLRGGFGVRVRGSGVRDGRKRYRGSTLAVVHHMTRFATAEA
jgi:hypothetical protein